MTSQDIQVKQHFLLMTGPLVTVSLQDRKTQTRRVITWSNSYVDGRISKFWREHWQELDFSKAWPDDGPSPAGNLGPYLHVPFPPDGTVHRIYPRYQVGDLIWIKETWCYAAPSGFDARGDGGEFWYRATDEGQCEGPWKSSRFMPKRAARLWLIVKKVRPERLQAISEEDAIAEGVTVSKALEILAQYYGDSHKYRVAFSSLWDSLNAKRGYPWTNNPPVWSIDFEKVKP